MFSDSPDQNLFRALLAGALSCAAIVGLAVPGQAQNVDLGGSDFSLTNKTVDNATNSGPGNADLVSFSGTNIVNGSINNGPVYATGVIVERPSSLTLNGSGSNYSGITFVYGTLLAGSNAVLSSNSDIRIGGGGAVDLGGFSQSVGTIALSSEAILKNGNVSAQIISDGGLISSIGGGLASVDAYTGPTTISGVNTFSAVSVRQAGSLLNSGNTQSSSPIVNAGTFNNTGTWTGSITSSGVFVNNGGTVNGAVSNAGTGSLTGGALGSLTNSGGTFNVTGGSINGTTQIDGGSVTNAGGTLGQVVISADGSFSNSTGTTGHVSNAGTGSLTGGALGSLTNSGGGVFHVVGGSIDGSLSNAGTIDVNGASTVKGALVNDIGGQLNINAGGSLASLDRLANSGASNVKAGGLLQASGGIDNHADGSLNVEENASALGNIANAGAVLNKGSSTGHVTSNTGTIENRAAANWVGNVEASAGRLTNAGAWTGSISSVGAFENTSSGIVNGNLSIMDGTARNSGAIQGNVSTTGGTFINEKLISNQVYNAASFVNRSDGVMAGLLTIVDGDVTNSGKLNGGVLLTGGVLTTTGSVTGGVINAGAVNAQGTIFGVIENKEGGAFTLTGALTLNDALHNAGNARLDGHQVTGMTSLVMSGGTFDLGGVTLITSGPLKLTGGTILGGVLNSSSFDVQAGVIEAQLIGSGSLTKLSAGIVDLGAANTYEGDTNIQDGTLRAQIDYGLPSSTALLIAQSGAMDLNGFKLTVTSLTGAGEMRLGLGTLTLTTDQDYTFGGSLTGEGALIKDGSGTFTLSGDSSMSGPTLLRQGKIDVTGSTMSEVTIFAGATLMGTGTVGGIIAQAGGTLVPGGRINPGAMNVTGNVEMKAGSNFHVLLTAAAQSSVLNVTGTATLGGGVVTVSAAPGSYVANAKYLILSAAGGISGTFGQVKSNMAFLFPTLSYEGGSVYLVTQSPRYLDGVLQNSSVVSIQSALSSIDPTSLTADGQNAISQIQGLSVDDAGRTLLRMSGAVLSGLMQQICLRRPGWGTACWSMSHRPSKDLLRLMSPKLRHPRPTLTTFSRKEEERLRNCVDLSRSGKQHCAAAILSMAWVMLVISVR